MPDKFETNARTVTLLTLVSRVTGLARDAAFSRVFGAGPLMSAFFFAFMIPNLFRRLFGEGALSAAFLPSYAKLHENDPQTAKALASLVVSKLMVVLGVLTIAGELGLMAIASTGSADNTAIELMMIMLPYMPLVCLVAILGAMLQVHGRFGPTAAAPIILNVCLIGTTTGLLFVFDSEDSSERILHVSFIAGSVALAGLIQVGWSLAALRRTSWWVKDSSAAKSEFRNVLLMAGPMILSLGVLQFNTFLDGLIASYPVTFETNQVFGYDYPLDDSAMATLSFGQRLYQFPLGVFGIAIATAIFPLLSKQADDTDAFVKTLKRGLRLVIYIGLPASAGLILVRNELAAVIYQGGEFTAEESRRVGLVLLGYAPAIWAYSMTHTLIRAFYAKGDSKRPMRVALGIVVLNVVLNLILIWYLQEAGLAWATAICAIVQTVILLILLRKHVAGVLDKTVRGSWFKSIGATAVMSVCVWLIAGQLPLAESWTQHLYTLAILVGAGGLVMIIVSVLLKMPELQWAFGFRAKK